MKCFVGCTRLTVYHKERKMFQGEKRKNYISLLILSLIISFLYWNSLYWTEKNYEWRKVCICLLIVFCVAFLPFALVRIQRINDYISLKRKEIKKLNSFAKDNGKRILIYCLIYGIAILLSYLITLILSQFHYKQAFNLYRFFFSLTLVYLTLTIFLLRKIAAVKPEILCLAVILILGVFLIKVSPAIVGVSWDDEIHYERTLNLTNYPSGVMYKADIKMIDEQYNNLKSHLGYDRVSKEKYSKELNEMYERREVETYSFEQYGFWSVAYIPSAIGIILGRGLGLSFTGIFMLGKFFNLLAYALLIYYAVKKIKYGKILIMVIGLIPTNVFMAASYSYDPWIIGFIILGYAYFFSYLQEENSMVGDKEILIPIILITAGCLPKAIYFPLLFPVMLIPRKKLIDKMPRKRVIMYVLTAMIFLVITFLLPMLLGIEMSDLRGGTDVNSTEQIKFILKNPIFYAQVLYGFYKSYLAITNIGYGFQHYAYMGYGMLWGIVTLIVVVVAFLDRDDKKSVSIWIKLAGIIAGIGAIILATTALYISFTGVGATTVAGMHDRYVFPTIFPILYLLGIDGGKHGINKSAFACVPVYIIALTFLYNVNMLCVTLY